MRVSEARTTNKKVMYLNDIKGVDLTSSPIRVKNTRASYMKNMICEGGVNKKRNGFKEMNSFYDEEGNALPINGIFPFVTINGVENVLVHAGKYLYLCNEDCQWVEEIKLGEIGEKKTKCFFNKEKCYLLSNNKLLIYDGDASLSSLFDNKDVYVPTTSIGITDDAHGSLMQPFEGVNLFSTKRINKLSGARRGTVKTLSTDATKSIFTLDGSESTFYLDGEMDFSKNVKITTNVFLSGTALESEATIPLYAKYQREISGEATIDTVYNVNVSTVFEFSVGETEKDGKSTFLKDGVLYEVDSFYEEVGQFDTNETEFEGNFNCKIANVGGRGVVTFTPALPSPILGEDNITVEYCVKKEEPKIKAICECNANTYNRMLAIATEDDIVYFSSPSEGYSYFPDNNYLKAINNVSSLIAGGDFLGVASKDELAIVTFSIDSSGEKIACVPSLVKKHRDVGCINAYSQAYVEGDTLFLSSKGVYGASLSDVFMRSSNINKELTALGEEKLKNAVALEHDGRYYLFVDGVVYIADARYKTYESNRLDVSYEYEWWRWENCQCNVAVSFNDKIWIGRDDGKVMVQYEGYSDTTYYELQAGEVAITDGNSFTFNEEIKLNEGDKIEVKNAQASIMQLSSVYLTKDTKLNRISIVLDAEDFISLLQKGIIKAGKRLTFYNEERGKYSFKIWSYDTVESTIVGDSIEGDSFYESITVFVDSDGLYTPVKRSDENYELFNIFNEKVCFIETEEACVTVVKNKPVECEMHTSVLSLGEDTNKKTLHKIIFLPGLGTCGKIQIGFETDKKSRLLEQQVGDELNFSDLNFDNFTFDSTSYKTFEKRLHERNVQFVKFKVSSNEDAPFSVEQFSVVFSTNTR